MTEQNNILLLLNIFSLILMALTILALLDLYKIYEQKMETKTQNLAKIVDYKTNEPNGNYWQGTKRTRKPRFIENKITTYPPN